MRQFRDTKGRTWKVELNVRQMKRVRDALGVDLVNVIEARRDGTVAADTLERVANDPVLLADILWVLCEGEAKPAPLPGHPPDGGQPAAGGYGVTEEEFGASLAGDVISDATRAFLDELVDFFPGARRLFLRKAVDLARKCEAEGEAVLKAALESPGLAERLKTSLSSPAASPGSAASTPTPSP